MPVPPEEFVAAIEADLNDFVVPTHPDISYYASLNPNSLTPVDRRAHKLAVRCTTRSGEYLDYDISGNLITRFGGPSRDALHPERPRPVAVTGLKPNPGLRRDNNR